MGKSPYNLLAPRQCEGCGNTFQPQRRDQAYHSQAVNFEENGFTVVRGPDLLWGRMWVRAIVRFARTHILPQSAEGEDSYVRRASAKHEIAMNGLGNVLRSGHERCNLW
ncbi:hypothetical protein [Ktedonobacter robiniae]|nr:hypothetical protein [Ktedonobacter robiniae]